MVFKNKKPGILTYNYSVIIHVNFMELNQKTPKRGRASTWSPEDLQKALEALRNKYGLNEVSRLYGIPKPTLKRHLDGKNKFANGNVVQRGRMTVLPAELENELVSYINQLEGMLFGLTRNDIRYQIAEKNGLSHRFNKTEGMAGKDWFRDFKKRHNLSLRQPEATSLELINIPVEPIPSTSNSQHDQLLVQSSSDSSTIVATSPLTSSNEPRFGATAQSSINSNYSHLELSISAYNAIPTEPDGRCFFRSICISLHEHLQLTDRDSSGVVCSLQVKIQEKALADSLRAQVVDYICKNIERYTDLDAATLCADMPHAKFDNIFERLDSISRPNTMVGELEIIATTKLLRKPIVIMNATSNVVLKYGMNDFPSSSAVVIRFTNIGDDVGHYDCLIPSRQSKSKYIPVTAISPIPVKEKHHVKQKKKSFQSEILTSSPYKKNSCGCCYCKKK
nr:jerky protein-like [Biomphalaria glabrata]